MSSDLRSLKAGWLHYRRVHFSRQCFPTALINQAENLSVLQRIRVTRRTELSKCWHWGQKMARHVKSLRAQVWSPTSTKRLGVWDYSCNSSTGNAEAEGSWGSLSSQPIKATNSRSVRKPVSENKVCCSWGMTPSLTSAFHISVHTHAHTCVHTYSCLHIHTKKMLILTWNTLSSPGLFIQLYEQCQYQVLSLETAVLEPRPITWPCRMDLWHFITFLSDLG